MFEEADTDLSGQVSFNEFEAIMGTPRMKVYLAAIDLHTDEATELFHLLDSDGSGEISVPEFIQGCLSLRGPAKAIDFAIFATRNEVITARLDMQIRSIEGVLRRSQMNRNPGPLHPPPNSDATYSV